MAIIKRGSVYWYEFTYQGIRHRASSHSANKDVCKRAAAERRRQLELGSNGLAEIAKPKRCSVALKECCEENEPHQTASTIAMHDSSRRLHLEPFFGKYPLSEISAKRINEYQRFRIKEGASNRTINIEVGLLRMVLKKHKLWANIVDEVRMLRERKDVGRELSEDEQHRLLTAAKASASRSLYPAILTSIHSGLRNKELRLLRWRQVDLLDGSITVGKSKTVAGEGRVVPLSEIALQTLKDWRSQPRTTVYRGKPAVVSSSEVRPEDYVFPRESYRLQGRKGLYGGKVAPYETFADDPIGSWKTAWLTAKKVAKVQCRWHDLRHSFVSRVAAGGAADQTIKALAGWMSAKMLEVYSHSRNEAKRMAVSVFDQPLPKSTTQ